MALNQKAKSRTITTTTTTTSTIVTAEGVLINTGVTVPQEEAPVQIVIAGEEDRSGNNDQLTGLDLDLGGSETGSGLWVP